MATQKDVAKLANVSFITVSRVINNMGNVKSDTRKRVEEAIKELNYYPNSIAQGLNRNKIKTLAIQTPLPLNASVEGNSYYTRILIGIERAAVKNGFDILISAQRGSEMELDFLKPFYERKADGVIIIGAKPTSKQIEHIIMDNIPAILIGDRLENSKINYVDSDNYNGMIKATEYIISMGHKKIGYIQGNTITYNSNERFKGFSKILLENNIELNENWIFYGNFSKEAGIDAYHYFKNLKNRPTAIISSTDLMAVGFYEESLKYDFNIPKDISIIGFDGHEICSYTNPPLGTIYQPLEEMGEKATQIIINQIEDSNFRSQRIIFNVTLLHGQSVKDITIM
ncbi:MAG: LacI family DNA-binding transcriptional regulator [Spirochaetales bacterium]|nr:LacI family DNA-binding transcriptional regulator [Spirochaetales bacterium]